MSALIPTNHAAIYLCYSVYVLWTNIIVAMFNTSFFMNLALLDLIFPQDQEVMEVWRPTHSLEWHSLNLLDSSSSSYSLYSREAKWWCYAFIRGSMWRMTGSSMSRLLFKGDGIWCWRGGQWWIWKHWEPTYILADSAFGKQAKPVNNGKPLKGNSDLWELIDYRKTRCAAALLTEAILHYVRLLTAISVMIIGITVIEFCQELMRAEGPKKHPTPHMPCTTML